MINVLQQLKKVRNKFLIKKIQKILFLGNPKGYHCMIIDDLVQSGGTLIECAQGLLEHGATNISAFVGHGIFPNESWKKFLHSNSPQVHFHTFYVTNTYPNTEVLINQPPFKVLSIAQLLSNICFT